MQDERLVARRPRPARSGRPSAGARRCTGSARCGRPGTAGRRARRRSTAARSRPRTGRSRSAPTRSPRGSSGRSEPRAAQRSSDDGRIPAEMRFESSSSGCPCRKRPRRHHMAAGTPTPEGHYVKRVTLPSGKTIEVVYFESARVEAEQPAPRGAPDARTSTSASSAPPSSSTRSSGKRPAPRTGASRSAAPTASGPRPASSPRTSSTTSTRRLDEGTEQLVSDLKQLMHANMSEEIDRFVDGARRRSSPARRLLAARRR